MLATYGYGQGGAVASYGYGGGSLIQLAAKIIFFVAKRILNFITK